MKGRLNIWLLAVAALCAVSLWAGLRGAGGPGPGAEAPVATTGVAGTVHVVVLNGTDRGGLAREIGLLLGPAGCVVAGVANAPAGPYPESLLVNRRLPEATAADLAARLGGVPVVREWDERTGEDAVLVLGEDWQRVQTALVPSRN